MSDHVKDFVHNLFEHGCQIYDRDTKEKKNEGGAAFFYIPNWRRADGSEDIRIENEELFKTLKGIPALSIYAGDRILTDDKGDKLALEDSEREGYQHGWSCLFVYNQMCDFNPDVGKLTALTIVTKVPELKGAVEPLGNYVEFLRAQGAVYTGEDGVDYIKGAVTRNAMQRYGPCKLRGMVIIAMSSGPSGSGALWSRVQRSQKMAMSSRTLDNPIPE